MLYNCTVHNSQEPALGVIDGPLVLDQLRCNGVLEALRIVAQGFPNRLLFEDFRNRFRILSAKRADWDIDAEEASKYICKDIGLEVGKDYECGNTKLFFRVGVLGHLEGKRTARINTVITQLQAHIRGYLFVYRLKVHEKQAQYAVVMQKNVRYWMELRKWPWLHLMKMVKLNMRSSFLLLHAKIEKLENERDELKQKLEEKQVEQKAERAQFKTQIESVKEEVVAEKIEREKLEISLSELNRVNSNKISSLDSEIDQLKRKVESLNKTVQSRTNQLTETQKSYEKVQEVNKNLELQVHETELKLQQSKTENRQLQRFLDEVQDEYKESQRKCEELLSKMETQLRESLLKDSEIARLKEQMEKMLISNEENLQDLRARHAAMVKQLQDKIDLLHKKALKLETENQQLKAQIYTEPLPIDGEPKRASLRDSISRSSSSVGLGLRLLTPSPTREQPARLTLAARNRHSRQTAELEFAMIQIEDLERQKLELITDKRMMRAEIESGLRALDTSTEQRDQLSAQLHIAHTDIAHLHRRIATETEEKHQLMKEIRQLKNEIMQHEQRTSKILAEKEIEIDAERMRGMKNRSESEHALNRLSAVEKLCSALREEADRCRRGMFEANRTIDVLEHKVRNDLPNKDRSYED